MTLHAGQPTEFLTEVSVPGDLQAAVGAHTGQAIDSLDPERGNLLAAAWLRPSTGQSVLVLAAHVLAMDPVSWQVVLGELDATLHALRRRQVARARPRAHQLPPLGPRDDRARRIP